MAKKDAIDITTLMGKSSRTYATRKVTQEMISARTHVAIALWDIPWKSAPHGKLYGWVIAVEAGGKRRFVRTGKTMDADPYPRVFAEFERAVKSVPKPIWVVVGRRQAALGTRIRRAGYLVTGSFADENKAGNRARGLRKQHEAQAVRRSKKEGERPAKQAPAVEAPPTHWLPNRSRFAGRGQQVRIATDASSDTLSKGAMCFVASNGDYQLRTRMTKAGTDELELETITLALKYALKNGFERVIIESDSVAALEAVDNILAGGRGAKSRRTWRGVSSGARSRFQQAWRDFNKQGKATIGRVLGHAVDPLNHAADRIAYLGLRASNFPEKESRATAWKEIDNILRQLPGKLAR